MQRRPTKKEGQSRLIPKRRLPRSAGGKKKQNEGGGGVIAKKVRKQHTAGLANVEEGRLADKLKPKVKTRQRKRPVLGSAYKNIN